MPSLFEKEKGEANIQSQPAETNDISVIEDNHHTFEQMTHYGELPNTGMELNMRAAYDVVSRSNRDYKCREKAADSLATLVNQKTRELNLNDFPQNGDHSEYALTLKNDGWVKIPDILSKSQIDDILAYVQDKPIIDFYNEHKIFTLNNIPPETNVGRYTPQFNLNCPHIFDVINNPAVLKIAEEFLGAKPTLSVLLLMWSFKNTNPAQQMQKFHRDNDDFRFCKVFVLLTDVEDELDGPHLYIKKSHSQDDVAQDIKNMDISEQEKQEKLHAIFEGGPGHRYSEDLVNEIFPKERFCYHKGKKGTTIMEDTWGVHRGVPPKRKHRLIVQAQFSLQPTPMFTYRPLNIEGQQLSSKEIKYVNRMYIR